MTRFTLPLSTLLTCALLTTACTHTHAPTKEVSMVDADEQREWQKQTLSNVAEQPEINLGGTSFTFESLVLPEQEVEPLWITIYSVLDALRSQTQNKKIEAGFQALMTELEPDARASTTPTRIELNYLSRQKNNGNAAQEGIGLRLWRAVDQRTPTLTVVLWREEHHPEPEQILIWTHPDTHQGASSSILSQQCMLTTEGILPEQDLSTLCTQSQAQGSELQHAILAASRVMLWSSFTGDRQEQLLEQTPQKSTDALHPGLSPHLGLTQQERDIEDVLADTHFPPRFDLDEL